MKNDVKARLFQPLLVKLVCLDVKTCSGGTVGWICLGECCLPSWRDVIGTALKHLCAERFTRVNLKSLKNAATDGH